MSGKTAVVRKERKESESENPAVALVQSLFSIYFVPVEVKLKPFVANLLKYKAIIEDVTVPPVYGFVDSEGRYMTYGSKVITNAKEIAKILERTTPTPLIRLNLQAYELQTPCYKIIIFVDTEHRYIIAGGMIYDQNLDPITFIVSSLLIPTDYTKLLWKKSKGLSYVLVGNPNAPKAMNAVIAEPNCPICHDLYVQTLPFVTSGELKIYWTFVSFIDATSRGKIFAIWDGRVPEGSEFPRTSLGAFVYNETFFTDESGGLHPIDNPSQCAICSANKSQDFFLKYLFQGTPTILYINLEGEPALLVGLPSPIKEFIASIHPHSSSRFHLTPIRVCCQ